MLGQGAREADYEAVHQGKAAGGEFAIMIFSLFTRKNPVDWAARLEADRAARFASFPVQDYRRRRAAARKGRPTTLHLEPHMVLREGLGG